MGSIWHRIYKAASGNDRLSRIQRNKVADVPRYVDLHDLDFWADDSNGVGSAHDDDDYVVFEGDITSNGVRICVNIPSAQLPLIDR